MSGSEWAAVVGRAGVPGRCWCVLVVMIVRLDRAAKDLRQAARRLPGRGRARARRAARGRSATADFELDRVDAIVTGAERVGGRVDAASDLAYRTFTNPVVKALAVGTGTRRAVQRLQGRQAAQARAAKRKAS